MAIDLLRRSDEPPAAPPRGQASEPVFPKRPSPIGILRVLPALAGLVLGIVTLSKASAASIGPYGLIQALPKGYFVALGLVLISFPLTWSRRRPSRIEFAIEVVILVFLLEAAPSIIEAAPRFPSAWLIAGFSDYIARTGRVLPLVDARFSWPSMMAGAALLARVAGVRSTVEFLRWFPLFINLLYLPPLFLIAKTILRNEKYAMLVTWLFPLANWVGQDYFSPQAVTFLLLLVLVYIVLGPFRARLPWLWRPAPYDHVDERGPVDGRAGLVLLGALTVLTLAMASGHQLTPAFAILFVFLFALTGRTRLRVFPALMLVITMGWICYGAVAFWAGHTGKVFGRIGKFASNVTTSTTARIAGSHAHHLVTTSRVLAAFMIWGLGILGFLVARRARIDRLTALVMLASPFVVLLGQDYGGEGGLRVYLASLPGALCLTAALFAWRPRARGELTAEDGAGHDGYFGATVRGIAVLVLSAVMVPTFLVARWGNELYEQVRPGEVSGVEALYRLAPPGSVLLAMDSHLPWRTVSLTDYKYIVSRYDEFETMDISGLAKALSETPKGGFIIITTAQIQYEEQVAGLPSSWNAAFTKALLGSGKFKRVFTNANTQIYQYTGAISGG